MFKFNAVIAQALAILLSFCLTAPDGLARQPVPDSAPMNATAHALGPDGGELLDATEEADLSTREEAPGPEVRGGALSNLHLTYIVIALAAIVLVLLIK